MGTGWIRGGEDWLVFYSFVIYLKKPHNRAGTQESRQSASRTSGSQMLRVWLAVQRAVSGPLRPPCLAVPGTPFFRSGTRNSISSGQLCPSQPLEAHLSTVHWLCCPSPTSWACPLQPSLSRASEEGRRSVPGRAGCPHVFSRLPPPALQQSSQACSSSRLRCDRGSAPSAPCPRPVAG